MMGGGWGGLSSPSMEEMCAVHRQPQLFQIPQRWQAPLTCIPSIASEEAPEVTQEPHKAWELRNGLGSFQRKDPVVVGPHRNKNRPKRAKPLP